MVENIAICIAACLQLFGCGFFLTQPEDQCSPAPPYGSWLFLLATLVFLSNICIYPRRFMHMPRYWQLMFEIVSTIFLTEVGTMIIWCGLERIIYNVTDEVLRHMDLTHCYPWRYQNYLTGILTTAVSGSVLRYMIKATDGMYYLEKFLSKLKINLRLSWKMLVCYANMNATARRRALKVCQLATRRRRRGPPACNHNYDEDDDDEDDDEDC